MTKQAAHRSTPNKNFTVKRRYLTEREVERLMDTARKESRHGHRDATMILVAYRHGMRASEVCNLEWSQIELDAWSSACPQSQERHTERPSHPW
jgi:integrase